MVSDPRFDACLPPILREEGGNDDDPQDHGGRTSRGVIQREYTSWRLKHGLPDQDVWLATNDEIRTIYYEGYWSLRGPKLHPGVDLVWFNFAVNAGPAEANRLLMRSISDSLDDSLTVNRMCNAGEVFYRGLAQFPRYGDGWTRRTERIRTEAIKMVVAPQTPLPQPKPQTEPISPQTKGHIMLDVTQIVDDVNIGLSIAEKMSPLFSLMFGPQVGALISGALMGARTIEAQLGLPAGAAVVAATAHVTAGAPNSPALGPTTPPAT